MRKQKLFKKRLITISKPKKHNQYKNRYSNQKWRKFFNSCEYSIFYVKKEAEDIGRISNIKYEFIYNKDKDKYINLRKYFNKIYTYIGKSSKK